MPDHRAAKVFAAPFWHYNEAPQFAHRAKPS
jgi:hypothetical protein